MHVLILNIYFHPELTGTGLVVGEMARDLFRLGLRVSVVTTVPHYGLDSPDATYRGSLIQDETWEGVRVLRTAVPVTRRKTLISRLSTYLAYAALAVPAALRAERPDVVLAVLPPLTTGPAAWLVSRIRRVPLIFNVQDVYPDVLLGSSVLARLTRWLERVVLGQAAALTVLSQGQRDTLVERGIDSTRISVVPMWTDLAGVQPGPRHNAFRHQHGAGAVLLALYAGNIGTYSGVGTVLEAAHLLRDDARIRFLIVGRGHGRDAALRRAADLDLPNVTFLPTQPRERLSEMLAAADVGLVTLDPRLAVGNVPSKTFTIMAAARPVLAAVSDRNEVARVVREAGCGRVVAPADPAGVAAALREWVADPAVLDPMGRAGRSWVERFHGRESAIRSHLDVLRKALAVGSRRES